MKKRALGSRGVRSSRIWPRPALALIVMILLTTGCADGEPCPGQTGCEVDGLPLCVDTAADPLHCGGCGNACVPTRDCRGGECVCPAVAPTPCGEACIDLETDVDNCGGCGAACEFGNDCQQGRCVWANWAPRCQEDEILCRDGLCTDLAEPLHCGDCRRACGQGERCEDGTCVPFELLCEGSYRPIDYVPEHCGACGVACAESQFCALRDCLPLEGREVLWARAYCEAQQAAGCIPATSYQSCVSVTATLLIPRSALCAGIIEAGMPCLNDPDVVLVCGAHSFPEKCQLLNLFFSDCF
jgi:hypothetical protein